MKKGFSLQELLIAVVILGILAMIAIPRLIGNSNKVKLSDITLTLTRFEKSSYTYFMDYDAFPEQGSRLDFHEQNTDVADYDWTGNSLTISLHSGDCEGKTIISTIEYISEEYYEESVTTESSTKKNDDKDTDDCDGNAGAGDDGKEKKNAKDYCDDESTTGEDIDEELLLGIIVTHSGTAFENADCKADLTLIKVGSFKKD